MKKSKLKETKKKQPQEEYQDSSDETSSDEVKKASVNTADSKSELVETAGAANSYQNKIVKEMKKKEERDISVYGFPERETMQRIEREWQHHVTSKFFRIGKPLKDGKTSQKIYARIIKYIDHNETAPINITGLTRRSFIIALSKVISEYDGMPKLAFKIGEGSFATIIRFEPSTDGAVRQKGNFKMVVPGIYDIAYGDSCMKQIRYMLEAHWDNNTDSNQRRSELIKHIRDRLQTFKPFDYKVFNNYGKINIFSEDFGYGGNVKNNIHFLNGLIFLVTVVEVLVRLYRDETGNIHEYADQQAIQSDAFPVAIAQSRSLLLLLSGQIDFTAFLGESVNIRPGYNHQQHRAYYGAVTGKRTIDHIEIMLEKLAAINTKYNANLFTPVKQASVWREFHDEYIASNPNGGLCAGRSRMYFDLKTVYGSGQESDEESSGYSDTEVLEEEVVIRTSKR